MVDLSRRELMKWLDYDPMSGIFTWIKRPSNRVKVGEVAGTSDKHGYINIQLHGAIYKAHRLAFLYMTGKMPEQVDHEDHNAANNKWDNLRPASDSINRKNTPLLNNNTSGYCGVSWSDDRRKWEAKIQVNGKTINLGRYNKLEDAAQARKDAANSYGFHKNHGMRRRDSF